jgi:outer membrane protein assembly factor BamB
MRTFLAYRRTPHILHFVYFNREMHTRFLPSALSPARFEELMFARCVLLGVACLVAGAAASFADDWPQWRGPNRDDISKETGLLKEWPKGGPKLLWKTDKAGLGFSGFSIVGDVLYTMGARDEEEYALAFSVKDGSQLWTAKIGPIFIEPLKQYGDGPRGTPTVDGDHVYCLGGQGELVCLKRDKGALVWRKNLIKDLKGQIMVFSDSVTGPGGWGYSESPLVDGDQLICCPGGPDGWMISLDKLIGAIKWRTKELPDQATDSSVVVATIEGVRQYINSTYKDSNEGGGMAGVEAKTGKVLWHFPIKKYNTYAVCPTPVVKDNLVYGTAGYAAGCNLLRITKDAAGKFDAKDSYNNKARQTMQNDHGGVVLVDGHIYGYCDGRGWVCQEFMTGKEIWSERNALDGKGSLTYADGRLYLLSDEGEAVLLKATAEGWQETGRFSLPARSSSLQTRPSQRSAGVWTHPVVANGRLYLRDQELIYCYAVR